MALSAIAHAAALQMLRYRTRAVTPIMRRAVLWMMPRVMATTTRRCLPHDASCGLSRLAWPTCPYTLSSPCIGCASPSSGRAWRRNNCHASSQGDGGGAQRDSRRRPRAQGRGEHTSQGSARALRGERHRRRRAGASNAAPANAAPANAALANAADGACKAADDDNAAALTKCASAAARSSSKSAAGPDSVTWSSSVTTRAIKR